MSERTKTLERPTTMAAPAMAARAVALCEGCPMARFCVTKNSGECPPEVVAPETDQSVSYRDALQDDGRPVVMANLQIRPLGGGDALELEAKRRERDREKLRKLTLEKAAADAKRAAEKQAMENKRREQARRQLAKSASQPQPKVVRPKTSLIGELIESTMEMLGGAMGGKKIV